jgi:type VI secretion system protein ImpM
MPAVIYGKHPAFGDFLTHGMAHAQFLKLDNWLNDVLPIVQSVLADDWEANWRSARPLRFWIGPDVVGAPLMGLIAMSQDKVGRRYPLIFGLTGYSVPSPISEGHSEALYDLLWAHVSNFVMPKTGTQGSTTLLEGFVEPDLSAFPWLQDENSTIWGQRADGDISRLLLDAQHAEHHKAQVSRSHWWRAAPNNGAAPADWLAATGLPDASAFYWLLTGQVAPQDLDDDLRAKRGG